MEEADRLFSAGSGEGNQVKVHNLLEQATRKVNAVM